MDTIPHHQHAAERSDRTLTQSGKHEFDRLCAKFDIEHQLPPGSPQSNGMVERFNGPIEDVLQSHRFRFGEEPETTLHRCVWLYNQQLPQSASGNKTRLQAMKDRHKPRPVPFRKQPYNRPGGGTGRGQGSYAVSSAAL